jgi:small conductance mechanosensitive channel
MLIPLVVAFLIAVTPAGRAAKPKTPPGTSPETAQATPTDPFSTLIAGLRASAQARDSLTLLADTTKGTSRDFLEESIWQRHIEVDAALIAAADMIAAERARGGDVSKARHAIDAEIREEWPRFLALIRRWQHRLAELGTESDAASGSVRLTIEAHMTQQADRLLEAYQSLVDAVLAMERVDIDVAKQRAFVVDGLKAAGVGLVTRVQLAKRDRASAAARLARDASNADLRYASEASEERFKRATQTLSTAILLMDRMGLEDTDLRVALISATGRMTADVFKGKVLLGLLKAWWARMVDFVVVRAPQWLFQMLLITLTFIGFRALAKLVRRIVRRAVGHSNLSELMRGTIVRLSAYGVMLVGYLVILTQLGVQVAPLLAGLGIAGFVVGFAMQNTLANFAAGGMILGNQPFDVGDEIEVAGVFGTVKRMSLVSTTILTPDNQTLIIPNSTVWGGVIRNRTAQPIRRVDLAFNVGYGDDIEKAERVLREIVAGHASVLTDPAPVVRLNQLSDSSIIFVVRTWTPRDKYWDVYWDLTRAVKVRFDAEGITIPFPQRELHLKVDQSGGEGGGVTLGGPRRES